MIVRELMSGNCELCRNLLYYKSGSWMQRVWISWTMNITSNYAWHGGIKTMSVVFPRWIWHQNFREEYANIYGPTLMSAFICSIRNMIRMMIRNELPQTQKCYCFWNYVLLSGINKGISPEKKKNDIIHLFKR